jgi:S1-C subfamily serine protease
MLVNTGPARAQAIDIEEAEAGVVRVRADFSQGYSTGTGFIINAQGYIATNWHVINIEGNFSDRISVYPSNSAQQIPVQRIWASSALDLAILRVNGNLGRPPVPLALGLPKKGDEVFAVGFPGVALNWGSPHVSTVTRGVLSRVIVGSWGRGGRFTLVQHSAQINKGNSGGPLFDQCGRVIGVNTQGPFMTVVRNGQPVAIPTGTGVFVASQITALMGELRSQNIPFMEVGSTCKGAGGLDPAAAKQLEETKRALGKTQAEIERARLETAAADARVDSIIRQLAIWGPILLLLVAAAIILALRKPRERVVQVVKGYGEQISRRMSKPVERPSRSGGPPRSGLCFAGFDSNGAPVRLTVEGGKLATTAGIVVGRHPDLTDIVVGDGGVSRRHVRVRRKENRMWLEDLNTTNGTKLNQRPLVPFKPVEIRAGDQIHMGRMGLSVSRL